MPVVQTKRRCKSSYRQVATEYHRHGCLESAASQAKASLTAVFTVQGCRLPSNNYSPITTREKRWRR